MRDKVCIAKDFVVPADFESTGVNLNELIVGSTGCGKCMSNVYSRLVHTFDSSVVVTLSKKEVREKFSDMFKQRGYDVVHIDFVKPENSTASFDPLEYVETYADILALARRMVDSAERKNSTADPYWSEAGVSFVAAEIALVKKNEQYTGKKASLADVIAFNDYMERKSSKNGEANLGRFFDYADEIFPGNAATKLWRSVAAVPEGTFACLTSVANVALDKFATDSICRMMKMNKKMDFRQLGKKKTALFITTSPFDMNSQNLINLMYSGIIGELFALSQESENNRLDVPVHLVFDDFACGSRIFDFEKYISIFRAAGISVSLLLQSESQLKAMYGDASAATIINNCDTYVYMGGMDTDTVNHVSKLVNMPMGELMGMEPGKVVVLRRGVKPFQTYRYQVLDDPLYRKVMKLDNKDEMTLEEKSIEEEMACEK